MFDRQFPHALIHHPDPIFKREFQRLGKPSTPHELAAYDRETIIFLHVGTWGFFCVWLVGIPIIITPRLAFAAAFTVTFGGLGLVILGLFIVASGIISDLYYMVATVLNAHGAVHSPEWDMLRLTAIPGDRLLAARLAIAQIRAWRFMTLETVARAVLLEPLVLLAFGAFVGGGRAYADEYFHLFRFTMVILVSATLFLEPLWRMRTLTTFGLLISLQYSDPSQNILKAAALALGSFAIRLAIWIPVLYFVVLQFSAFDRYSFDGILLPWELWAIYPFVAFIGSIVLFRLVYAVYKFLQRRAARRAALLIDFPN